MDSALDIESNFKRLRNRFRKCTTNLERTNFFLTEITPNFEFPGYHNSKNDAKSIEEREKGNKNFKNGKYVQSLEKYTESLAWANSPQIAALAYANRSAALIKLGLTKECLIDIDRAIKNEYPKESQEKLVVRRKEAIKMQKTNVPKQKPQTEVPSSENIEIQKDEKYGRYIIASRDIEIGEILVSEKPVALVLMQDFYIYCHECLQICYNLVPCDFCPKVMYCGKKCKQKAFKIYHRYECAMMDTINSLESFKYNLSVSLKTTLKIFNDLHYRGKSRLLDEIRQSVAHTEDRPLRMLFAISYMSSLIYQLLKLKTNLFTDFMDFEEVFKELYPVCVQVVHINGVLLNRVEPKQSGYESIVYAQGLYLAYSHFNHSCYPNAFFYHEGSTLVVRALGSIKAGEQCFIAYRHTYATTPKAQRQVYLQENFFFKCSCIACVKNWLLEEENDAFDEPFGYVSVGQQQNDRELLQSLVPTFTSRLKACEKFAPKSEICCLRQLVVDCYLNYELPRQLPA